VVATSSITGIGEVEHRQLAGTVLRAVLSTTVLVTAYYLIPIPHHGPRRGGVIFELGTMVRLSVAFAIFVAVLTIEIGAITRARHPMLRAGVAMAVVLPLFLLFFAWMYVNMSNSTWDTFHTAMDKTTALYFTVTIFSTVGFGDITPHTDLARLATTIQMIADLAVVAVVVRLILGAASRSTAERQAGTDPGEGSTG
jgi:ACR3 family arsenite efflux pump ArsB